MAHIPEYRALVAAYSRDPEGSLERLSRSLVSKWGPEDVDREDDSHRREYESTKADKNLIDRYIISQIGLANSGNSDKRVSELIARKIAMRRAWEKLNPGKDFTRGIPGRLARFRQYRDIPFNS